jgi:hypothetical protein
MRRIAIAFLKTVLVLAGAGALAFLLWEPHIEGRNAHATVVAIYFHDPFLAYAYTASIPFFVALRQGFALLGQAGRGTLFSPAGVKALRTVQYCALAIIGFVLAGEVLFILFNDSDDRAGGVFMGLLISFGAAVTAAAATVLQAVLQDAMARMKADAAA